jgi:hypothetical protein
MEDRRGWPGLDISRVDLGSSPTRLVEPRPLDLAGVGVLLTIEAGDQGLGEPGASLFRELERFSEEFVGSA